MVRRAYRRREQPRDWSHGSGCCIGGGPIGIRDNVPGLVLEAGHNRVRFGVPSPRFQPSRRLRQVATKPPDDGAAQRTGDEHPPPSVDAERLPRHERTRQESDGGHTDEAQCVGHRGIAAAMAWRQELAEIRVDQRELSADADARDKPRGDQHARAGGERAEQGEARIDRQVEQERAPAAETVGHHAEAQGPEKHAQKARREHERQRHAIEVKAIDQDRAEDAGEKDVEEIEERPDAGNRHDRAMRRVIGSRSRRAAIT